MTPLDRSRPRQPAAVEEPWNVRPFYPSIALALALSSAVLAQVVTVRAEAEADLGLDARWSVATLAGKPASRAGDISFSGGEVSGATSCNFFRGTARRSPPHDLEIIVGMMTRRGCSGEAAELEREFLHVMARTHSFRVDGDTLSLADSSGTTMAVLKRAERAQLEGQRHKIVSYLSNGGLYSIRPGSNPTITLANGKITGSTGCRRFHGHYALKGDTLEITAIESAPSATTCNDGNVDQDEGILAAVPKARTFDTNRNLIRLLETADGAAVLWITPDTW